jgi:hypothetical protein
MSIFAEPPTALIDAGQTAAPVSIVFRGSLDGSGPLLWQRHRIGETTSSDVTPWSRVDTAEITADPAHPGTDGRINTQVRLGEMYEALMVNDIDIDPNANIDTNTLNGRVAVLGLRRDGQVGDLVVQEDFPAAGTMFHWVVGVARPGFATAQVSAQPAITGTQGLLAFNAPVLDSVAGDRFAGSHVIVTTTPSLAPGNAFHALLTVVDEQGSWQIRDRPFTLLQRHITVEHQTLHVIDDGADGDTSATFFAWVLRGNRLLNRLTVPKQDISDSPSPGHESEEFIDLRRFEANTLTIPAFTVEDAAGGDTGNNTAVMAVLTRGIADVLVGTDHIAGNFLPGPAPAPPSDRFSGTAISPDAFFRFPVGRNETVLRQPLTVRATPPTADTEFEYDVTSLISVGYGATGGIGTTSSPLIVAAQFAHWSAADPNGATGMLYGSAVTLAGPMGTAFFLKDDYPGFNSPDFSPPLSATGMIEIVSRPGHTFTLTSAAPLRDPVFDLGSFGSVLTFPAGTQVSRLGGDANFVVAGNQVTGCAQGTPGSDGTLCAADSRGSIRVTGSFTTITFTLEPNFGDGSIPDGVFLQVGGA